MLRLADASASFDRPVDSLDELCRALNKGRYRGEQHQFSNTADLPKWGVAPPDVSGLWSWDATRVLVSDRNGNFFIEPRDPDIRYPNDKSVSRP